MILKRGHYLYFFYYWLYSMVMDFRIAGKTMSYTIFNRDKRKYPVQCISYPYLHELDMVLKIGEKDVFVDVGCAWGRLLGYFGKKYKKNRWIGVEYNRAVAEQACKCFEKAKNIEIIQGDILENLPIDGTIFYLFNPFDEELLGRFVEKLEKEIKGAVTLLYLHPVHRQVVDHRDGWKLVKETELKPRHLGAITLCVYKKEESQGLAGDSSLEVK